MRLSVCECVPALLSRFRSFHTPNVERSAAWTATYPRHLVIAPIHENLHVLAVADMETRPLLLPQQGVALDAEPPAIHCQPPFSEPGFVLRGVGTPLACLESIVFHREIPSKRVK
jgi:hypothetical protein